jgi:GNAT superfamily N-acetyltransferase
MRGRQPAGQADNRIMTADAPDITVTTIHPGSAEGREVLTAYYHDIVSRYHGREATADEVSAAMRAEPSDGLCPPRGLLLAARRAGTVLGCAGLHLLPAGVGEVTRVFVMPDARRHGIGARLLRAVEEAARERALLMLRLDTRHDLTEAQQLYERNGYREVPAFSDGRFADRWYAKSLG